MDIENIKIKLSKMSDVIIENKEYLTELDRAIGDADHGYNMAKGFTAVKEILNNEYKSVKELINKIALTLISNVGGASGPLYGTFFMKFAQDLDESLSIEKDQFARAFKKGLDGVVMRGKAKVYDKTMVDVIEPVSIALLENKSYDEIVKLAKEKMEETKNMKALKGRASYLGDRSIGHIDPGACSSYLMIKSLIGDLNG